MKRDFLKIHVDSQPLSHQAVDTLTHYSLLQIAAAHDSALPRSVAYSQSHCVRLGSPEAD